MSAQVIVNFLAADTSALGRIDYTTLSQQAMMEFLVQNQPGERFCFPGSTHFADVDQWEGVTITDGVVTKIEWNHIGRPRGTIDMRWIPPSVVYLELSGFTVENFDVGNFPRNLCYVCMYWCAIGTTIDTPRLPPLLKTLWFVDSGIKGTLDCTKLPPGLTRVNVSKNMLTGSVDLTSLPPALELLDLSNNNFQGALDLSHIAHNLALKLNSNQFSGEIPIFAYCGKQEGLTIFSNAFTGAIRYTGEERGGGQFPWLRFIYAVRNNFSAVDWESLAGVAFFDASFNKISGSFPAARVPHSITVLFLSNNALTGRINLNEIHEGLTQLRLDRNGLTGGLDLTEVPTGLEALDISHNSLSDALVIGTVSPPHLFLAHNRIKALRIDHTASWAHVRKFCVANNTVVQGTVRFGKFKATWRSFDLRGNDIGSCRYSSNKEITSDTVKWREAVQQGAASARRTTRGRCVRGEGFVSEGQ